MVKKQEKAMVVGILSDNIFTKKAISAGTPEQKTLYNFT